jgi:putative hemolysin
VLALTIGEFLIEQAWRLGLLALLLAGAAFFSGAETALFALSRGELFRLAHDSRRLARLAAALMRRPDNVLTTVLLGTNLARILYFVFFTLLIVEVRTTVPHGQVWASVLALVSLLAVILLSEVLPKTICFLAPVRLAPLVAAPLAAAGRVVRPIRRVLMAFLVEPLTRLLAPARRRRGELNADEMAALLALSQKRGIIGQDETELIQEVLELTDLRAGDIMVPRVDVVAYDADGPTRGLLALIRRTQITKIPVYAGDLDHVVGVVYAKRLLVSPGRSIRQVLNPVEFVPESAPLERVLMQLRAARRQLAIVVDEYGGTAGLITLEDILEEIVGDIPDANEARRSPPVQQVGPAEWLVDGDLPVHEWADAFPTELAGARFSTVGGFVISLLQQVPRVGLSAEYHNVAFTVEAVRRRRIALLRVTLKEPAA